MLEHYFWMPGIQIQNLNFICLVPKIPKPKPYFPFTPFLPSKPNPAKGLRSSPLAHRPKPASSRPRQPSSRAPPRQPSRPSWPGSRCRPASPALTAPQPMTGGPRLSSLSRGRAGLRRRPSPTRARVPVRGPHAKEPRSGYLRRAAAPGPPTRAA
jgi:hypothetical protein